jgi:hypothetical protein
MPSSAPTHTWNFFRSGGLDQVSLTTAEDLLSLDQLDQKLWVALSCPVKGLELDEKTLALIDTDKDGRIRVPELIATVKWAVARLNEPAALLRENADLPLASINTSTDDGKILLSSAKQILLNLGKKDATQISVTDAADTAKIFSASALNGDGVIPPEATEDPAVQALIKDIIACAGGTADRTGSQGVTVEKIETFFADLAAYVAWVEKSATKDIAILGSETDAACSALKAVRAKVEDYFTRTRLAAFDIRALAALNRSETEYLAIAAKDLTITAAEVAGFPLSRITANSPLPLLENVNPAWSAALATLHAKAVAPIYGGAKTSLTEQEWAELNAKFAAYETWLGGKVGSTVEKLGLDRVKEILAGPGRVALARLVALDKALEPEFKAISDVERLVRLYRDLRTLLHNFVNFADFYSPERYAVFQAGTLFLDSRSTELCVRVDGPNPLAAMSKAYIAYCTLTRAGSPAMIIAACFTQGDSDYLFVGRHGVFYDRAGRDWDAVITSIVDNPISIRQAFWSPYKKFLRFIEEQVAKRAAAADAEATGKLAAAAEKTANVDKAKPEPPKKLDLALITGISVAIGSIGTFASLIFAKFVDIPYWKLPLVFIGAILVISLPSMIIAWLKLRQRTIGPILEGNGWAVNGRVKINIPFGSALTDVAKLPPGSHRSLEDPYEDKEAAKQRRRGVLLFVLVVIAGLAWWIRWDSTQHGHLYFWKFEERAAWARQQEAKAVEAAAPPAAAPKK